ncbi:MAG TPA: sulfatase [Opitutae bacterium]|nr:sulfatase [Opitutae bacterium]
MTRATTLILFILFSVCLMGREGPPNFLVIYMDDLGWADTSVRMMDSEPDSRSDFYRTPNLEKLAARGMRFSNGYAPAPTCTPSRKSIQFGKTPARLGYTFVHDVLAIKRGLSWAEEASLADVLKASDQNYVTAHFGKGMGKEQMKTIGYDAHDEFDGRASNGNFHGDYVDLKSRRPLPADDPKRIYSLTARSVDFLGKHAGKRPFLLMVSHYAVHVPHQATPAVIERYRKLPRGKYLTDADYLPPNQIAKARKTSAWRLQYAAMIDEVDAGMGKMMEVLEKSGELENTYVIYTSDNGGGLGPNGPLSWGKAQLFEGGLRVPWVVAGPGVKAGAQCDVPVVQWDLLPTLHDLSGSKAPLPKNLDGGSLRDLLLKGNAGKVIRPVEGLIFHYPCYFAPPLSVIRLGDHKLMRHLLTGERRLYDVVKDPAEETNLIRSMRSKADQLDSVMKKYLEDIGAEDVGEVYQARLEELDLFEVRAKENFRKKTRDLDPKKDAAEVARLKAKLQADLERFARNRVEVDLNRNSSHWAGSPPKSN